MTMTTIQSKFDTIPRNRPRVDPQNLERTALVPVQRVTVESDRPLSEVVARLDEEINKTGSASLLRSFGEDRPREELVEKINEGLGHGEHDFL
jgi:hypothetical protein